MLALFLLLTTTPHPVWIEGGTHSRGRDDGRADERPRHDVYVDGFYIDDALVSVDDFAAYVDATHRRTSAERLGFGYVAVLGMKDWEWQKVEGAFWRAPFGGLIAFENKGDLPVTQVSWRDADAYCRHRNMRLPTEAEWEAAMAAGSRGRYPWGDSPVRDDGRYGLNYWQGATRGEEHSENQQLDGYLYLSPVRAFPPNKNGIYDPVGNVWQLTNDWYDPTAYATEAKENPRGPTTGTKKVTRGGSWWCSARTCHGFGLWYRGKNDVDAPFNNVGFRCASSSLPVAPPAPGAKTATP